MRALLGTSVLHLGEQLGRRRELGFNIVYIPITGQSAFEAWMRKRNAHLEAAFHQPFPAVPQGGRALPPSMAASSESNGFVQVAWDTDELPGIGREEQAELTEIWRRRIRRRIARTDDRPPGPVAPGA